jgi:murein DD-endopeptidase MepM/ murein hydrolase activator NlpD
LTLPARAETLRLLARLPAVLPAAALSRAAVASLVLALVTACGGHRRVAARPTVPAPASPASPASPPGPPVSAEDLAYLKARQLLLPVANVRARSLRSSFSDPRDGGARTHFALDIMAPRGTPVLAADDGRVWTVRSNALGGLTVYTTDPADRFVFYYAHLDSYHPSLADGRALLKGDTLGFVGTTGNAPADVPHLHFQVARIGPDRRWWTGTPIDPLPFLRDPEVALAGRVAPATAAAVAAARADRAEAFVVPAIRTRPVRPTVPAADSSADSTARRRR